MSQLREHFLAEWNVMISQNTLDLARFVQRAVFLSSDEISAHRWLFACERKERRRFGHERTNADKPARADFTAQCRVDGHAASLREAADNDALTVNRKRPRDLVYVEENIGEALIVIVPTVTARFTRVEHLPGLGREHQPALPSRNVPMLQIRILVPVSSMHR